MNVKKLVVLACLACMGVVGAQEAVPPATDAPEERPLGGFPGCMLAPAKDSCDERITCKGVGKLFGNTGTDLQDATDEAESEANAALAKFAAMVASEPKKEAPNAAPVACVLLLVRSRAAPLPHWTAYHRTAPLTQP